MQIRLDWLSLSCFALIASVALGACGDGGRPRRLDEPGVLHDNGGSGGSGGSPQTGLGGADSNGGTGGEDGEDLDAGTGGYQIGTDWDGNTNPTSDNVRGVDAAAGEGDRGTADPDGGDGG